MRFKSGFLHNYLANAPIALAVERSLECDIFSKQDFIHPILDMGCGDGLFAHMLFDERVDTGIDLNAKELKRAKTYDIYDEVINCSVSNIPRKDGSYATIFSNSTLEHVCDLEGALKEAHRLLARGGRLYLTVPSNMFDRFTVIYQGLCFCKLKGAAQRYCSFFNRFWKHHHHYTKEDWIKIFRQAGFAVKEAKQYGSKEICLMSDSLVPFASFSLLTKALFNRWILCGPLRKIYIHPFYLIARNIIKKTETTESGGLIFFSLAKK